MVEQSFARTIFKELILYQVLEVKGLLLGYNLNIPFAPLFHKSFTIYLASKINLDTITVEFITTLHRGTYQFVCT